jgi:regulator of protease activity HflC (stomatin/prohibitin superfamily)
MAGTMDFSWLSDIFNGILKFIPRPIIVRATHSGVKWVFGKKVKELKPGWHFVWPLVTDWEVVVIARQTNNLQNQALVTKDKQQVVAGALIVFSVKDIIQAIGERNWDVGTTVNDIAQASIVGVVTKWALDDLLVNLTGSVEEELTAACRKQLRQFGVYVHRCCFTDFAPCRIYKLMGSEKQPAFNSADGY